MREQIKNVRYNLSDINNFVEINLYEASPGMTPVKKEDSVLITNTMITSMMIIEVKTKNLVYPKDFLSLKLQLFEDVMTNSIQFRMYKINSLSYPSSLPSSFNVITQQTEDKTGYKKRLFDVGGYLTSANTTYYFFVQPYAKSGSSRCNIELNVNSNVNKLALINIEYLYDMQLPQYLKFDSNTFENHQINVNLFNGKLYVNKKLFNIKGKALPLTLSLSYLNNYPDNGYRYLTESIYYSFSDLWKFNFSQYIKKDCIEDKYIYINDAGEQLNFSKAVEKGYVNDEGRAMYMITCEEEYVVTDGDNNSYTLVDKYIIEDIDGNQLRFNSDGYLIRIKGHFDDVHIIYQNNKISKIIDSNKKEILFNYSQDNKIIITYKNKMVTINLLNNKIVSVVDMYDITSNYTYNENNLLNTISCDINSVEFEQTSNELTKLMFFKNNKIMDTKEYLYDENVEGTTTLTTYYKEKNDSNQIIKKYCFNSNGDYTNDYEDVKGVIYNENKRFENVFDYEVNNAITSIDQYIINEDNVIECNTPYDKSYSNHNYNFEINKAEDKKNYILIYNFFVDSSYIRGLTGDEGEVNIVINEKIGEENKILHNLNLRGNKNGMFYLVDSTHSIYIRKYDNYSGYTFEAKINLDWNEILSNQIELSFEINLERITGVKIESAFLIASSSDVPIAFFSNALLNSIQSQNMYFYNPISNYIRDTERLTKETLYGYVKPCLIKYRNSNENLNPIVINSLSLQEILTNAKNMGRKKDVFWYNNYKGVIVIDNLYYYDSPYPNIYFEDTLNDCLRVYNLSCTIPMTDKYDKTSYNIYSVLNAGAYNNYGEMDDIEIKLKELDDNYILVNILHKDKYNRIVSEETTYKAKLDDNYYENYIYIKKMYEYDNNNNLVSEKKVYNEIGDQNLEYGLYYSRIYYNYDENNNLTSIIEKRQPTFLPDDENEEGLVTHLYYDENDNLIKVTSPLNNEINYVYDDKDRYISINSENNTLALNNLFTYSNNLIEKIKYNNSNSGYKYVYNNDKNVEAMYKINEEKNLNSLIESYEIVDEIDENNVLNLEFGQNGLIITFADGNKYANIFDKYGKLIYKKIYENNQYNLIKEYQYVDGNTQTNGKIYKNLLKREIDYLSNFMLEYNYNKYNEVISINKYQLDNNVLIDEINSQYNNGKLVSLSNNNINNTYRYDVAELLSNESIMTPSGNINISYSYDAFGYVSKKEYTHLDLKNSTELVYDPATGLFHTYSLPYQLKNYSLTYDDENKLTVIKNKNNNINDLEYTYNEFGHLIKEDNKYLNRRYEYSYDAGGNIINKKVYDLNNDLLDTIEYTYDEPHYDVLTKITKNNDTINISYNSCLNPTSIGSETLEWEKGKNLSRYIKGNNTYNYYYNADGIRIKKALNKTNNEIIEYNVIGDRILSETHKLEVSNEYQIDYKLNYIYESNGILGFIYEKGEEQTLYTYERDALNNIVSLVKITDSIEIVAYYKYNAWGEHFVYDADGLLNNLETFIGNINPFRYKGYYYDVETGLFWLSSRYYSPELGRFLQVSDISELNPHSINGLNLYAYANNNPISFSYNNSSVVGSTNVAGGLVSSIGAGNSFTGNVNSGSPSKGGLNLGWLANGLDTGSTIHGLYTSISGLVNHTAYFAKNLTPFADDMTMLGASMKDGVLAFNQFSWGLGKSDIFGIALGVGLDIYDSIQRGVSPGGVVLGATLTAAKGIGLIYLNKGILYGATALGSAICPGVGTVVGFVVGGVVCIVVDIFASNWLDDLIDKIAK